jgi:hypothetical protein
MTCACVSVWVRMSVGRGRSGGRAVQEHLDMSFAEADDAAVVALADALGNKLQLRQLELNGNKFHPPTEAGPWPCPTADHPRADAQS